MKLFLILNMFLILNLLTITQCLSNIDYYGNGMKSSKKMKNLRKG